MPKKQIHRWINEASTDLLNTVIKLKTLHRAQKFFRDLLTEAEIRELSNRWKVAQMLQKKIPFLQIAQATGMSPNTIARINKWRKKGLGGYRMLLRNG